MRRRQDDYPTVDPRGAAITIKPGRPFWSGFTAFAANMVALFGVDTLSITQLDVTVGNWWSAVIISLFVGLVVYGKEKMVDLQPMNGDV